MQFFSKICAQIAFTIIVTVNGENVGQEQEFIDCPNWPRFIILGAQKAGTSSLYDALVEHPSVCEATIKDGDPDYYTKEVHYFDLWRRWKEGPEFYCSYFQGCDNHPKRYNQVRNKKSGTGQDFVHADITPDYLDYKIASHMEKTFSPQARKEMKLIAVLREPVSRMLSWYNHIRSDLLTEECPEGYHYCNRILRKNFVNATDEFLGDPLLGLSKKPVTIAQGDGLSEQLSFEEFVFTDFRSVHKSKYIDILKEFYEVFGMENVLVLNMDWMMKHQGRTLKLISQFIGIDNIWRPDSLLPYVNDNSFDGKMSLEDLDCDAVEEMDNFFHPYNEELYKFLLENKDKSWSGQPYFQRFKKPSCKNLHKLLYL